MRFTPLFVLAFLAAARLSAQAPIPIKVVVVTAFEAGEDTGDTPGEFQLWVEREHLDQILPFDAGNRHLRMNKDGVLAMVTGVGSAKAAASIMALGFDPRLDLSKAYWLVAGIGGGDPNDVSPGSAVWANHVVDGDIAYSIDARDLPKDWTTGIVPLYHTEPYQQPMRPEADGGVFTLNRSLAAWAYDLTKDTKLKNDLSLRRARARFPTFPNAQKPPFVALGDVLSTNMFWHGARFEDWANEWTRYFTGGRGNYMVASMEDVGTLQSLTMLSHVKRVDLDRVMVLRTVSNFDREPVGENAGDDLDGLVSGTFSAFSQAVEDAQLVGARVVHYLVEHWAENTTTPPR